MALQPEVIAYASPLKLFEYMALGRAILAPATAKIREVLNEKDALLFEPGNDAAFELGIKRLSGDPELRRHLGDAARAAVMQKGFTWASNARRIVSLFQSALESARKRASKIDSTPMGATDQLDPITEATDKPNRTS